MKFLSRFTSALALLGAVTTAWAAPAGFGPGVTPVSGLAALVMPAQDTAAAKPAPRSKPLPLRFALPIAVDVTPDNTGTWETLADGRLMWRALIQSANANSLNFGFTEYHMPAGGELNIYNADGSEVRGPYTTAHNKLGQLWTPLLRGSQGIIEVTLPAAAKSELKLHLTKVNHGFLEFWKDGATATDKSGSCNVDVVCPQGDAWRNEIRSVARYTISGQFLCSGQLVNNTAQDFTPYFLTAHHCLSSVGDAAATVYYWNYQTSACAGNPDGKLSDSQSGATLVATYETSDFTLLQLNDKPDAAYKVFYAGWSNDTAAPSDGVTCIHHPGGDEKRISSSTQPTHATSYGGTGSGDSTHLQVERWTSGTTEGGSSGSGLWDNAHHLVGQLHGGEASCDAPTSSDWFGRLAVSWGGGGDDASSLKPHLDPLKSSAVTLDGADPASPGKSIGSGAGASVGRYGGALPLLSLALLGGFAAFRRFLQQG